MDDAHVEDDQGAPQADLVRPWTDRVVHAEDVIESFERILDWDGTDADDAEIAAFLAAVDSQSHVGARHHTVPRFLLARWADKFERVQVYGRIEEKFALRNIRDLAIKDFYTFIDLDNRKNSSMEFILGEHIEKPAAEVLRNLSNPYVSPQATAIQDLATLAQFAAYQVVRTARHRRESELHAEWLAKTVAGGRISDTQLRNITVTPHQNDAIRHMGDHARRLIALFACRPLALVHLDRSRLFIGDDPVLINPGPEGSTHHHPDCFLTDQELAERARRAQRKYKKGRRRPRHPQGRIVHFYSTVPRGLGTAAEIVLPISPRAVLYWGPLQDVPYVGPIERERLDETESERFADLVNDQMCGQALDWIVTTVTDEKFQSRKFPPTGPLMQVCDGVNAASVALNEAPQRFRPSRLWQ